MVELVLNSPPVRRNLPRNTAMPIYQYQILNGKKPSEIIEIEQPRDAEPLLRHPLTNEPIKRLITSPSLALKHSSQIEKKSLSKENLEKHGFTRYERDQLGSLYNRTAGDGSPHFEKS